eukprot:gene28767-34730_t
MPNPGSLDSQTLPDLSRIYLYSNMYELYARNLDGAIVLTEAIPWAHGSALEVHRYDEYCFQLKSSRNTWLRIDSRTKELVADGLVKMDGALFAAVLTEKSFPNSSLRLDNIALKLCDQDVFLQAIERHVDQQAASPRRSLHATQRDVIIKAMHAGEVHLLQSSLQHDNNKTSKQKHGHKHSKNSNKHSGEGHEQKTHAAPFAFTIQFVREIRGVNLGGWFIPEVWMNRDFYEGTGLGWGGSLCGLTNMSRALADKRMAHQLAHWITEKDFEEISAIGFNSVRLPVGYWNVLRDPYGMYAPSSLALSLQYIDFTFRMAAAHNLTVLLDMHGAPGSQNGIDHSGCSEPPTWMAPANLKLTLQALEQMVRRYGNHPALLGIELMNEPSRYYSDERHADVVQFYAEAYKIIRKVDKRCLVVFNELYETNFMKYKHDLQEPEFYNVVMDMHLYHWQEPYTRMSRERHVSGAANWAGMLEVYSPMFPLLVGEWSMSTGTYVQAGQPFVDACVKSFSRTAGWYLWNWKVQRGLNFDEWDVQYQYTLPTGGLRPL